MKVKTEEDAVLHCFDLWLWIACNPEKSKRRWPGWMSNGGYLEECMSYCPCCQYEEDNNEEDMPCENVCPLTWTVNGYWCGADNSPYKKWHDSRTPLGKTMYALEICALAIDAM